MNIFEENKNYTLQEVSDICDKHGLAIVDCLKDENMISIEEWNDGDGRDSIFEFKRIEKSIFKLSWQEK